MEGLWIAGKETNNSKHLLKFPTCSVESDEHALMCFPRIHGRKFEIPKRYNIFEQMVRIAAFIEVELIFENSTFAGFTSIFGCGGGGESFRFSA